MEYWDVLEISEIDDFYDRQERKYSLNLSNASEEYISGFSNISVALSPHLSEDYISDEKPKIKEILKITQSSEKKAIMHFPSRVGTLTYEQRQVKLQRYRQKKKNRVWCKKINYNCRKKVAENRLRIKGRFVTKQQALVLQQLHESYEAVN